MLGDLRPLELLKVVLNAPGIRISAIQARKSRLGPIDYDCTQFGIFPFLMVLLKCMSFIGCTKISTWT